MLALAANELVFIGADSHSTVACSHYLQMETVSRSELDVALPTKQPPAKAGGFELKTGSPDTRRLNDASMAALF